MRMKRRKRKQSLRHLDGGKSNDFFFLNITAVIRIKHDEGQSSGKDNEREKALKSNQLHLNSIWIVFHQTCCCLLLVMAPVCENSFAINMQKPFQGIGIFFLHKVMSCLSFES